MFECPPLHISFVFWLASLNINHFSSFLLLKSRAHVPFAFSQEKIAAMRAAAAEEDRVVLPEELEMKEGGA